ncbi:unnamed protein product [Rotaria sp. Silwood1]|nr:unnamed protein product [Rotaria sp. Silwood1]
MSIELNKLIKDEIEIAHEYENKIEIKEKEYIEQFHQVDIHYQSSINKMEIKIKELNEIKFNLKSEHQLKQYELIKIKENLINIYNQDKIKHYKDVIIQDKSLLFNIEYLYLNENQQILFINDLYQRYIELIHLSYRNKLNNIKKFFFQENEHLYERINYFEDIKYMIDEDADIEFNFLNEKYIKKLNIILNKIEQLENEQVLLNLRLEQLEQESNRFEDEIKQFESERYQLIDQIRQIDYDLNIAKQTIQQRNFIIQDKLKRTNDMENRQDELEKFAYVFNYKIRELTNEIAPRQHEVKALIEQYNNMDTEYDILCQNNEKYSIKIADYNARLKATEKELQYETIAIRKLNETIANIKEDLKLSCHLIDKPKQLIKIIRNIYGKYILQVHEQINMMREISSYCLKVVEVERILSDLDIVLNIPMNINRTTSYDIIHALKIEQTSDFIQEKTKRNKFNYK